ncbi:MAG: response regulator [Candidatus Anammoximicrobium sp.]|nr:response regulator [Candidatus Anammoximicrobium sp.]
MHASALRIVGAFVLLAAAWKGGAPWVCATSLGPFPGSVARDRADWLFVAAAAVALYGLTLWETRRQARRDAPAAQAPAQLLRAQRLESIGILAGGVAHDLNNVLTPILMAVKLLGKESREAERQGLLAIVQAGAERGADMVRQLLSFAGGLEGEKRPLHLKHVIREVHALLVRTLPKSIRLQVSVADSLWQVVGDATQLSQVLMNLCINARDAMPDGGALTILAENAVVDEGRARRLRAANPGRYVAVAVVDTGAGIPADVLAQIFDPFFTTKEWGHGTGLGLPTVLGIVKGHGGFVDIETDADRGTRFTSYFPARVAAESEAAPEDVVEPGLGRQELILVVDDEPAILETAQATLSAHGYRALTACDGREAVAVYRQRAGEIKVVLLDMMMPVMDGLAALRELRALDANVRIVAMSGMPVEARLESAFAAGANLFLPKPYTGEQLVSMIEAALRS